MIDRWAKYTTEERAHIIELMDGLPWAFYSQFGDEWESIVQEIAKIVTQANERKDRGHDLDWRPE